MSHVMPRSQLAIVSVVKLQQARCSRRVQIASPHTLLRAAERFQVFLLPHREDDCLLAHCRTRPGYLC